MAKSLVIVESPAKARTINKYLGKQFLVKASLGHIKDLPKKDLAVDVDRGFEPRYVVIEGKKKLIQELKQAAKKVDAVYLAADPDREGEAICHHLQEELAGVRNGKPEIYRVMFNEITKNAIERAFQKPGTVDVHLVEAQQARRVLDRLVGYKISPLLWDKVRRGLSAGRVQTVAVRLVVEREREVRKFQKREYWTSRRRSPPCSPSGWPGATAPPRNWRTSTPPTPCWRNWKTSPTRSNRSPRAKSAATPWPRSSPPPCSRRRPANCASA
jgi:DNA topoisomerase I